MERKRIWLHGDHPLLASLGFGSSAASTSVNGLVSWLPDVIEVDFNNNVTLADDSGFTLSATGTPSAFTLSNPQKISGRRWTFDVSPDVVDASLVLTIDYDDAAALLDDTGELIQTSQASVAVESIEGYAPLGAGDDEVYSPQGSSSIYTRVS